MTTAALDAAETLTADWTYEEVLAMRNAVPEQGISAPLPQHHAARDRPRGDGHLAHRAEEPRPQEPRRLRRDASSCRRSTRSSRAARPAPRRCSPPTTRAGAARSSRCSWNTPINRSSRAADWQKPLQSRRAKRTRLSTARISRRRPPMPTLFDMLAQAQNGNGMQAACPAIRPFDAADAGGGCRAAAGLFAGAASATPPTPMGSAPS